MSTFATLFIQGTWQCTHVLNISTVKYWFIFCSFNSMPTFESERDSCLKPSGVEWESTFPIFAISHCLDTHADWSARIWTSNDLLFLSIYRNFSSNAPSQWESAFQEDAICHWLVVHANRFQQIDRNIMSLLVEKKHESDCVVQEPAMCWTNVQHIY